MGGYPVQCRRFSSLHSFYPWDASSTTPLPTPTDNQRYLWTLPNAPWEENKSSQLRPTGQEQDHQKTWRVRFWSANFRGLPSPSLQMLLPALWQDSGNSSSNCTIDKKAQAKYGTWLNIVSPKLWRNYSEGVTYIFPNLPLLSTLDAFS